MTQTVNGVWKYRIGKGKWTEKEVPFSDLCVGKSECEKTFDLENRSSVVLLKFDGITYNAEVYLNNVHLGKMLPYSEYTFDITSIAKAKSNLLRVELEDVDCPFGPSEGWENYGGICRDVSVIYKNECYIKDVYFHSCFENDYRDATYTVEVGTSSDCEYRVTLSDGGRVVDTYVANSTTERKIKNVLPWSVVDPHLYWLRVELLDKAGNVTDTQEKRVGISEFKCSGNRFQLNGNDIFLKGVCRHEMYGENSGHTVAYEQIYNDMKMIKDTGCNFVRLVHYPHNKKTLDIADELGLLCCGEPGLWQADVKNPSVTSDCLSVLEKMVIRDRSHPSIAFWLAFNECDFDEKFLKSAVEICRKNDAFRLVSGANNMSNEETLKYYNLCNLDFYTMHPYSETFDMAKTAAEVLCDKPLMFTEWGGYYVYDNPHLLSDFLAKMYELYENHRLAGTCLWYWAEINDYNRGGAACVDGTLKEALVDFARRPNLIYSAFCKAIKSMGKPKKALDVYEFEEISTVSGIPLACKEKPDYELLLELMKQPLRSRLAKTRKKQIEYGAVLQKEEIKGISPVPFVTSDVPIVFDGISGCNSISILGLTAINYGYPILGAYGEDALEIDITCLDGSVESYIAKNGVDVSIAYTSLGSSRINPVCERAVPYARFSYDKNFEEYIINKLEIETQGKDIASVSVKSLNPNYKVLIYGIYGEQK